MFSQNHQSRFESTKRNQQQPKQQPKQSRLRRLPILINHLSHHFTPLSQTTGQFIASLFGPLALILCILSMSVFYQVMGAVKCRKIKKHSGERLRPLNKAKEPFMPNDVLLYSCETTEYTQSIRCHDDGSWTATPPCPDPANFTCPDLEPIEHGSFTASSASPYKVGTMLLFRCENELLQTNMNSSNSSTNNNQQITTLGPAQAPVTTTTAAVTTTTTTASEPQNIFQSQNITTTNSENYTSGAQSVLRYNLTGHRVLKCLPSSKWNHPAPTCTPVYPEPPSNVGFLLASTALILIPILILVVLFHLFIRWRKRQQQRERWKQYFTDYKYRHSKTSITFANRPNSQATVPVTDL
jgi:hypothetical protein